MIALQTPSVLVKIDGFRWRVFRTRDGFVRAILVRPNGKPGHSLRGIRLTLYRDGYGNWRVLKRRGVGRIVENVAVQNTLELAYRGLAV